MNTQRTSHADEVIVPMVRPGLHATLQVPADPAGIVLFAQGHGHATGNPRNDHVARVLRDARMATLLVDLLTEDEEAMDHRTARLSFDIPLLAERLVQATDWLATRRDTASLPVGYFGVGTGAAAALAAAARRPARVGAVVSRGGRPDLARPILAQLRAPTLLIVGSDDTPILSMNRYAMAQMGPGTATLQIVPGANHMFDHPREIERVAALARDWFSLHLRAPLA